MSEKLTLYEQGRLIEAAVLLHTHTEKAPPSPEQIAKLIDFSLEAVLHMLHKMADIGAVRLLSGAFGDRVLLDDYRRIEEIEGKDAKPAIDEEVAAFQAAQAAKNEETAKRFAKDFVDPKKQELKADLAAKLADPSKLKKADNPLDAMFKKKG